MTENPETPGEEARRGSTAPGLEGEGGQYVDGDYGDAGTVGEPAGNLAEAEYPDGDYGDAGTAGTAHEADAVRERLTDGQVNTTAEERGPLHGHSDNDR
ncbi:putative uncharacterized protein [Pseudarthrobacter siccitolerans]|uniref:Uncharacterized protein n=1 Tax=Pseudarthrobacter siccitolerans TaxID=861266 RepID=A0A024GWC6_9MICC|nr:hypothetical protein [Pseudarthrobacter siccitolerans]CCQ44190.1 putative uncharacterized protein [Pseudarthrobacter siccitolerans]